AQTRRGALALDASVGARFAGRGGGREVFGEASATLALGERTALFVAGGRYPTDPVSGSVAGRYVSGGVRLRVPGPARVVSHYSVPAASPPGTADDGDPVAGVRLEVLPRPDGALRRVLYIADPAADVEHAGDFTDWQPRHVRRVGN